MDQSPYNLSASSSVYSTPSPSPRSKTDPKKRRPPPRRPQPRRRSQPRSQPQSDSQNPQLNPYTQVQKYAVTKSALNTRTEILTELDQDLSTIQSHATELRRCLEEAERCILKEKEEAKSDETYNPQEPTATDDALSDEEQKALRCWEGEWEREMEGLMDRIHLSELRILVRAVSACPEGRDMWKEA